MVNKAWVVAGVAAVAWVVGVAQKATGTGAPVVAQVASSDWCQEGRGGWGRGARHCEVREFTLPAEAALQVDGSPNGGVEVEGASRGDVRVQARVEARAASEAEARALAGQVTLASAGGVLRANGPVNRGARDWSVSWRVWAPERTDLSLRAENGGLHVTRMAGDVDARTTNGGVHLDDVTGRVVARTVNGGLHLSLADGWHGEGIDAETTNGGVHLELPGDVDARLEASTVNGPISSDVALQRAARRGPGPVGGSVSAELGRGGPLLRLVTVNGPVRVSRR